jgi:hypothetical protein
MDPTLERALVECLEHALAGRRAEAAERLTRAAPAALA